MVRACRAVAPRETVPSAPSWGSRAAPWSCRKAALLRQFRLASPAKRLQLQQHGTRSYPAAICRSGHRTTRRVAQRNCGDTSLTMDGPILERSPAVPRQMDRRA